ncbi:seminal vesicle secretory protein 5 [Phodopus roborovskii]|uniref:Svs5 protein n=1 Tax=Phodopus roborovskii TaxID=109678 RepID=A0AAU9YPX7_PHORO|nr:seminal vesicle secretory protein 5 [Phodopus roborovskii]CAH6776827.1 Svs5 [Phodopus roborovskii]
MNPTSFFLLTLLLVLVTEPASGRFHDKFSQDTSENLELKTLGSSGGSSSSHDEFSHSESSWSAFKSKSPRTTITEEVFEERKQKQGNDDGNLNFKTRASEEEGMSSFKTRMKTQITGK